MSNGDLDWKNENTWNAMLDRSVANNSTLVIDFFSLVDLELQQLWQTASKGVF